MTASRSPGSTQAPVSVDADTAGASGVPARQRVMVPMTICAATLTPLQSGLLAVRL